MNNNLIKIKNLTKNFINNKLVVKVLKNLTTLCIEFKEFKPPNIFQLAIKYIYLFVICYILIYRFAFYRSINL